MPAERVWPLSRGSARAVACLPARHPDMHERTPPPRREMLIDFYRSCFMLFVFYHHTTQALPGAVDLFARFNPFAELFVGISGFVVAYVYLRRSDLSRLLRRALQILAAYYVVAIPVSVGGAMVGADQGSALWALLRVVGLQEDRTNIGILRFYGLMFLTLPWVLKLYRRHPSALVCGSAALFVFTTHVYSAWLHDEEGFFLRYVVLMLLQWQFFFVVGLVLGDLHRQGRLLVPALYTGTAALVLLGLVLDWATGSLSVGAKIPYNFEKYLNLLWTLPTLLVALYGVWRVARHARALKAILVVGENSLMAFVISEAMAQGVKLVVVTLGINLSPGVRQAIGISAGVAIVAVLHLYVRMRGRPLRAPTRNATALASGTPPKA